MNLCTEAEAKTKICPLLKLAKCEASRCMMWRFKVEHEPLTNAEMRDAGMAVGIAAALKPIIQPQRGYCGLAVEK